MALTNSEFNRALELGVGRQAQGLNPTFETRGNFSWADTKQDYLDIGENIIDSYQRGWNEQKEIFAKAAEQTPMETGTQAVASGVQNYILDPIAEGVMGALRMTVSQRKEEQTAEKFREALVTSGVADKMQDYVNYKNSLSPRAQRNLEAGETFVEGILETSGAGGLLKTGKFAKGAVSSVSKGARKIGGDVYEMVPTNVRNAIRRAPETDQQKLKTDLEDSIRASFVDDKPGVQNALDKIARRSGENINGDDLIRRLADEGVVPAVNGELSNFDDFFKYVEAEEARIGGQIERRLEQVPDTTSIKQIRQAAREQIINDPYVADIAKAERAVDRFLDTFEKRYGPNLTPVQLNQIRKTANKSTKAFGKEDFDLDAAAAVGNFARNRIDKMVKTDSVRAANSRLARLYQLRDVAVQLNNKKINTGELTNSLGSFMGTIAASTAGFAVAGPGGLVVAYLAARMGSKALAKLIREMRFGDKNRELIVAALRKDPVTVRRLINEADEADKEVLERLLLPAAGETSAGPIPIAAGPRGSTRPDFGSRVEAKDAPKGNVINDPKTGKFTKTFQAAEAESKRLLQQVEGRLAESSTKSTIDKLRGGSASSGFARFFGDPRRKALEDTLKQIGDQISRNESAGMKETHITQKNLFKARDSIYKRIDDLN